jgi:ribosomal protein S18 acetylase RimI-like enzyme
MIENFVPAGQRDNRTVTVREVRAEDEAFLYELYLSTRSEEIAAWGLEGAMLDNVMRLQFRAQQSHYSAQAFPVDHRIILVEDRPVGHIVVIRTDQEIRLGDIALLPEHRGRGIGAFFVEELFDEARETHKPVTLHVEKSNRAVRLYERMGFSVSGDTGTHFKMEWRPTTS